MQTPKWSICSNLGFIGLDYRTGGFKILMGKCVFEKLENVLSPGGRLLCRLLRGPFVFNLGFIGLDYRTGSFKNTGDDRLF